MTEAPLLDEAINGANKRLAFIEEKYACGPQAEGAEDTRYFQSSLTYALCFPIGKDDEFKRNEVASCTIALYEADNGNWKAVRGELVKRAGEFSEESLSKAFLNLAQSLPE